MQTIPLEERPRERLLHVGEQALSDSELLAIVLGSGTKDLSAVGLAQLLITRFGSLSNLAEASLEELCSVKGIGQVKAIEMRAVFTLVKRLLKTSKVARSKIANSEDAYHAFVDLFYGEKKEILAILLLDSRLNLIGREVVGIGTLNEVLIHPREVFIPAIKRGAHTIILAHNHPSGELEPSKADKVITERLHLAGEILNIQVNDHLIICDDTYYSMQTKK